MYSVDILFNKSVLLAVKLVQVNLIFNITFKKRNQM